MEKIKTTAKAPWIKNLGDIPATLDYFEGSLYDALKEVEKDHPDLTAFIFMGKKTSYKEMICEIEKCARALRTIGVRENDRVTIALPNCPQA
ncbi:MAG: AMP-binding protein, partial [Clostridia bacterium]|nr:AMP-binding protein [Clostridia bacterium]